MPSQRKSRSASVPRTREHLRLQLEQAEAAAQRTRQEAETAKAELKTARKRHRRARKAAKQCRKEVKALRRELEQAGGAGAKTKRRSRGASRKAA